MKNILRISLLCILSQFFLIIKLQGQGCNVSYTPFIKTYPASLNDVDISISYISGDVTTLTQDKSDCCIDMFAGALLVGSNNQNSEFTFSFSIPVKDVIFLMRNTGAREQFIVRTDSEGDTELEVLGDCKDNYRVSGSKIQSLIGGVATAVRVKTQNCITKLNFQNYGNPAGTAITIFNFAPPPKAAGIVKACIGEKIYLSAKGGTAYKWSGPNEFSSNEQNPVIDNAQPINNGTYYVTITAPCGEFVRTIEATVSELVDKPAVSTPTKACQGGVLYLAAKGANSYSWKGPNKFFSTAQNPTIDSVQIGNAGIYTVLMSVNCGPVERNVEAIVDTPSVGGYVTSSFSAFCGKKEVTLTLSGHTGSILRWEYVTNFYNNGQYIGGSTPDIREVAGSADKNPIAIIPPNDFYAGKYFYYAVVKNGVCSEVNSHLNEIKNDRSATGGRILKKGTNLTSFGICKNGVIDIELSSFRGRVMTWQKTTSTSPVWRDVEGSAGKTILEVAGANINQTTYYRCLICTELGICAPPNYTAYSTVFKVTKAALCPNNDEISTMGNSNDMPFIAKVYPTVTSDALNIEIDNPHEQSVTLKIVDISGKVVQTAKHQLSSTTHLLHMNIYALNSGMYMLFIENQNGEKISYKFIKED